MYVVLKAVIYRQHADAQPWVRSVDYVTVKNGTDLRIAGDYRQPHDVGLK